MKQSEAPQSRRTRIGVEFMRRGMINERDDDAADNVATMVFWQFSSCNESIELPTSFPSVHYYLQKSTVWKGCHPSTMRASAAPPKPFRQLVLAGPSPPLPYYTLRLCGRHPHSTSTSC